jgi:hypothetical protein
MGPAWMQKHDKKLPPIYLEETIVMSPAQDVAVGRCGSLFGNDHKPWRGTNPEDLGIIIDAVGCAGGAVVAVLE